MSLSDIQHSHTHKTKGLKREQALVPQQSGFAPGVHICPMIHLHAHSHRQTDTYTHMHAWIPSYDWSHWETGRENKICPEGKAHCVWSRTVHVFGFSRFFVNQICTARGVSGSYLKLLLNASLVKSCLQPMALYCMTEEENVTKDTLSSSLCSSLYSAGICLLHRPKRETEGEKESGYTSRDDVFQFLLFH